MHIALQLQIKTQSLRHFNNNHLLSLQGFNHSSSKSPSLSPPKTQIKNPIIIICARKSSRRRYGSEKPTKFMLELISIFASNLNILPQPLDLVVRSLVGGDGGEVRFLINGLKGGGGRRRRRRNGKKMLGLSSVVVLGFSIILCLLFGKDYLRSELVFGFGLFIIIFVVAALSKHIKQWRRGLINKYIAGGVLLGMGIGLGLRGNEAMNWIKEMRASSSYSSTIVSGEVVKEEGNGHGE